MSATATPATSTPTVAAQVLTASSDPTVTSTTPARAHAAIVRVRWRGVPSMVENTPKPSTPKTA